MFFKKEKCKLEFTEQVPEKKEKVNSRVCFDGMVKVEIKELEQTTAINSMITEEGMNKLSRLTYDELILYYSAFLDGHEIKIAYNIAGTGHVSETLEYAAFKLLSKYIFDLISEHGQAKETKPD